MKNVTSKQLVSTSLGIIPYVSQSLTASFVTTPLKFWDKTMFSAQFAATGSVSGKFSVQGSDDEGNAWVDNQRKIDVYNWFELGSAVMTAQANPLVVISGSQQACHFIRTVFSSSNAVTNGTLFEVLVSKKGPQ